MGPSFPQASFQSSRVLWGYISLTHWHSWAGKSFSSRSSWDDWCKYAAAESRHWHHHRTDPVSYGGRERDGGREWERFQVICDLHLFLWLHMFLSSSRTIKSFDALVALEKGRGDIFQVIWDVRTEWLDIFLDAQERRRAASDHLQYFFLFFMCNHTWFFPAVFSSMTHTVAVSLACKVWCWSSLRH